MRHRRFRRIVLLVCEMLILFLVALQVFDGQAGTFLFLVLTALFLLMAVLYLLPQITNR